MKWTTAMPITPGWYWLRGDGEPATIFRLAFYGDVPILCYWVGDKCYRVDGVYGEFAGPIPEPEE